MIINGRNQDVKLPLTGAWSVFLEKSVVYIPAKIDSLDFMRIVRDIRECEYRFYCEPRRACAGGTLNIRKESKWIDVRCSNLLELKCVKDSAASIRRIDARDECAIRAGDLRGHEKKYHDLKSRHFDKQIPYRVMF